ncbi:MAG: ABC transporter ATP-binding protein [Mariprofundus sp.]|nr:ABC transporter ATP-binding protein [Mariprofundus sp.]
MTALLTVESLCFSVATGHVFQGSKTILDHVSFQVPRGAATAYLGPNGAGKTSTFRILCGLAAAASGSIHFDGQSVEAGLPPARFGFMPEQPYFYKNLSPNELLQGLGKLSGLDKQSLTPRIAEWAEKLEFSDILQQKLSTCSKGQVQRVGLAQALMHQPDFILLDEPLSGLDPLGRECVRKIIQAEVKRGATVLFSSHVLADAEAMCENVIVLNDGQIVFSGKTNSLLNTEENWIIRARWADDQQPALGTADIGSTDICTTEVGTADIQRDADDTWRITGNTEQQRNQIIHQILQSSHSQLISVEPERRTLEQAFVELLRGKNS